MGSRLVVFFPTHSIYMWLCPFGISGKLSVPEDIGKKKRENFIAMDENSVEKPLLLWGGADSVNKTPLFVSWVNWTQVCNIGYFPCMGCSYFPLPSTVCQ